MNSLLKPDFAVPLNDSTAKLLHRVALITAGAWIVIKLASVAVTLADYSSFEGIDGIPSLVTATLVGAASAVAQAVFALLIVRLLLHLVTRR